MKQNAAYDLSRFAPQQEQQPKPQVEVVRRDRNVVFEKKLAKLRIRCTLLAVSVILLMVMTVNSRTELNETMNSIQRSTSDLTDLQSEYIYLNYELESLVSLKNAEEFAENELGLIKLGQSQVEYVSLQSGNTIETAEKAEGVVPFAKYLFSAIIEMFS